MMASTHGTATRARIMAQRAAGPFLAKNPSKGPAKSELTPCACVGRPARAPQPRPHLLANEDCPHLFPGDVERLAHLQARARALHDDGVLAKLHASQRGVIAIGLERGQ